MRARYELFATDEPDNPKGNPWFDMPEVVPPGRARIRNGSPQQSTFVLIDDDGGLIYDSDLVEFESNKED